VLQIAAKMNSSVGCVDGISIKHLILVNGVVLRYRRMKYALFENPPWGRCSQMRVRISHEL